MDEPAFGTCGLLFCMHIVAKLIIGLFLGLGFIKLAIYRTKAHSMPKISQNMQNKSDMQCRYVRCNILTVVSNSHILLQT